MEHNLGKILSVYSTEHRRVQLSPQPGPLTRDQVKIVAGSQPKWILLLMETEDFLMVLKYSGYN